MVLCKDMEVEELCAEKDSRLQHHQCLLYPGATGHHRQMHPLIFACLGV